MREGASVAQPFEPIISPDHQRLIEEAKKVVKREEIDLSGLVEWQVKPDPQANPPKMRSGPLLDLKIEKVGVSVGSPAVFPYSSSVFVAVRANTTPEDQRQVYNLVTGKPVFEPIRAWDLDPTLCALSPDGRFLAAPFHLGLDLLILDTRKAASQRYHQPLSLPDTLQFLNFAGSERLVAVMTTGIVVWWTLPGDSPIEHRVPAARNGRGPLLRPQPRRRLPGLRHRTYKRRPGANRPDRPRLPPPDGNNPAAPKRPSRRCRL